MVAREEVAGLVLEWLRREDLNETADMLTREAHNLFARLKKPEVIGDRSYQSGTTLSSNILHLRSRPIFFLCINFIFRIYN